MPSTTSNPPRLHHNTAPDISLETINCPLCGSSRFTSVVSSPDRDTVGHQFSGTDRSVPIFNVVRCNECDLCYTNPRPNAMNIGRFYKADYAPYQLPSAQPKPPRQRNKILQKIFGKKPANWERGEIEPIGKCRLLDFGCGAGHFLHCMHNLGWQVTGLDFSEQVVEQIRSKLKLSAMVGTLPHPQLIPESYDLVTLWHSLEHVHQPLNVLKEVYKLIPPGGKVLVAVPNIDSAPFRWFGADWYGLDVPRHLTHFTPVTLRKMLECAGFQFEAMQMVRHSYWLRQSAELSARSGKKSLFLKLLKQRFASSIASKWYLTTGQSDSFAIIARKKY